MPTTIDIESQRMLLGSTPVRKLYHGASLIGIRIAELFAGGEPGVWYDPTDLSTLFQDPAGTTPVTAVEQPVGLMLDKSGNGNHAYQTTATSRPVLRQDGNGKHYLYFDGVDDSLVTSGIVWSAACDCFTAIRHTGGTSWVDVWLTTDSSIGFWAAGKSGSTASPNGTSLGSPAYFVDGTALNPVTRGEIYTRGTNQTRIIETRSLNLMANTGGLSIGGYTNYLLNGRLYGLVIAEGVTDAEASSVRRWLTGKAGVAL